MTCERALPTYESVSSRSKSNNNSAACGIARGETWGRHLTLCFSTATIVGLTRGGTGLSEEDKPYIILLRCSSEHQ